MIEVLKKEDLRAPYKIWINPAHIIDVMPWGKNNRGIKSEVRLRDGIIHKLADTMEEVVDKIRNFV